jgi:arylsulfatase A-like enzyme
LGNHRQLTGKVAPYEEEIRVTMIVRGPGVPAGKSLAHLTGNIDLAPTWAELAGAKIPAFVDGRSLVPLLGNNPPSQWRECFGIENGLLLTRERQRSTNIIFTNAVVELLEPPDQDDEYLAATPTPQRIALGIPDYRGLRTANYMYVEYITGEKELYDIKNDPYQLQNLAAKAYPHLLIQLAARLKELQTCQAAECRTIEDKPIQ